MQKRPFLSGFMIVRDGVAGGYPFLEAILAVLPACDEFLVSDGCSTDGTWPALQRLEASFPEKVRLYQDNWPDGYPNGTVLCEVSNWLRWRCQGEYCLYVQANEILHETSRPLISILPRIRPDVELFALPFHTVMGSELWWCTDYRRRLFKNLAHIVALGDAFDVGYGRPREASTAVPPNQWGKAVSCDLPRPFYRYRAVSPRNYITKLKTRLAMHTNPELIARWQAELDTARSALAACDGRSSVFWELMHPFLDGTRPDGAVRPMPRITTHPEGARHLLGRFTYDLEASLEYLGSVKLTPTRVSAG